MPGHLDEHWNDGTPMRKESVCFILIYWFYQAWWSIPDEGDNYLVNGI